MPEQPEIRAGVPQGQHIHYLMVRGLQLLDEWFPGLRDEIDGESGAPRVQIGLQTRYMLYQTWQPNVDTGMHTYVLERPHLEDMVRRRLLVYENVRLVDGTEAIDLTFEGQRISGVVTRKRPAGGEPETFPADLVVDASGRGSKAMSWLEYAHSLPDPVICEAIKDAKPLTDIVSFRNTANRWHAYEKLDRLPGTRPARSIRCMVRA